MARAAEPAAPPPPEEWSTWRYRDLVALLAPRLPAGASLVDLGAGTGNTLAFLRDALALGPLLAVEQDPARAALAEVRLGCPTLAASVLDPAAFPPHRGRFDVAVAGDLLHHLVGTSRRDSRAQARAALELARDLVRPGGWLALLEPTFRPRAVATLALHLKRAVARRRTLRLELGPAWLNPGPPVVCLHTADDLRRLLGALPGVEIVAEARHERYSPWPLRRGRVTLLARRA